MKSIEIYLYFLKVIICNLFVYENMQVLRSLDILGKLNHPSRDPFSDVLKIESTVKNS